MIQQFKILTFITLIFLFASCGNSNNTEAGGNLAISKNNDSISAEENRDQNLPNIVKGKVTKSLTAGETSEISHIYFEYYELNSDSPIYVKTVNELISKIVQNEFEESNKQKITSDLSKSYFSKILTDFKETFSEIEEEYMPWSMMDSIHISDQYSDFVHLEGFTYSFTGGAHGNGYESHLLVSKKTGKTLSLSDVFSNKKKLNALVDQYFRKSMGISANSDYQDEGFFIEGKLEANNNFYFTKNNLVFLYNSYEIGPYAIGAPSVEIPIGKIKDILKLNLN